MQQERLFRLAVEAVVVQAHFVPGEGWRLHITTRRGDEEWSDAVARWYDRLTTPELADVLEADLRSELGL